MKKEKKMIELCEKDLVLIILFILAFENKKEKLISAIEIAQVIYPGNQFLDDLKYVVAVAKDSIEVFQTLKRRQK